MTTMSNLSDDLVAEILSRVPLTSLRSVRSTCKKWEALSKNRIFGKTASSKNEFLRFMMMDFKVCSLRFNLQGIRDEEDYFVDLSIKQVSKFDQVEISKVLHCDGLLLCVIKDNSRLLVWNPYLGQTRWIQPRNAFQLFDRYAFGFANNSNRNHKILSVIYSFEGRNYVSGYEIYDFSSNSWRVLDCSPNWTIPLHQRSLSLNGNAYFCAKELMVGEGNIPDIKDGLVCFDFTSERFGPLLSLPFLSKEDETVTLSSIRDKQLAVLHQRWETCMVMTIWVTDKIDGNAVSWTKFLEVDINLLIGFQVDRFAGSFFY